MALEIPTLGSAIMLCFFLAGNSWMGQFGAVRWMPFSLFGMLKPIISLAGPFNNSVCVFTFGRFFFMCSIPMVGITLRINTAAPVPFGSVTILMQWYMP